MKSVAGERFEELKKKSREIKNRVDYTFLVV